MLTPKQEKFCREYTVDYNGTQAAIRAGYSAKTANEMAAQNLAKLSIQARLRELLKPHIQVNEISAGKVLEQLAAVADFAITDIVDDFDGSKPIYKPLNQWPDRAKRAVSGFDYSVTYDKDGSPNEKLKVLIDDRQAARVTILKALGAFDSFTSAIATLKNYGLHVGQSRDGQWILDDKRDTSTTK